MRRTLTRVFLSAWAAWAACCLSGCPSPCPAAPAPLPKRGRPKPPPPLPHACVARWYDCPYRTDFSAGGAYRAEGASGLVWTGRWRLDVAHGGGAVLVINETLDRADDSAWREYRIALAEGLRAGTFEPGGGPFTIAEE